MDKKTFRPGGILSGQTFAIDDQFVSYKNAYGKYATVPRKSIQAITIDTKGRGQSILKFIGQGTELASVKMPHKWALKTQKWLMEQLGI